MSISTEIERIENAKTAIQNAKTAIRTAINAKGGVLTENQPMSEYAVAITALQTGESVDLSFVTATASDILAGKIGADTSGNPVNGTIQTVTASLTDNVVTVPKGYIAKEQTLTVSEAAEPTVEGNTVTIHPGYVKAEQTIETEGGSMDFYKCAAVYGPYKVTRIRVSGAGTTTVNGDYELTDLKSGSNEEVWKLIGGNYYLYKMNGYNFGIDSDYTKEPYQALYYTEIYSENPDPTSGSWYTGYNYSEDKPTGTDPVPSVTKFQVTMDEDVPKTWDGYKAILTDGIYEFEKTLTTGLTYGTSYIPAVGGIYSADALVQVTGLFDNIVNNFPGSASLFAIDANVGINDLVTGAVPTVYGTAGEVLKNGEFRFDNTRAFDYTIGKSMSDLKEFTIEMDYTITSNTTGYCGFFGNKRSWSTMCVCMQWGRSGYRPAMFWNGYFDTTTGGTEHSEWVNDGVYHHVAMVKKGEVVTLYSDGVKIAQYSGATKNLNLAIENLLAVGTQHVENQIFPGRMKHFRVIGSAIYDGDFDIPEWVGKGSDSDNGDNGDSGSDGKTYLYTVSGSGTTAANGDYWESEEKLSNALGMQITAYTNGSCSLYQDPDNSFWYICNGTSVTDVLYMCDSGVSGTWEAVNGMAPAPTVTEYSADSGDSGNASGDVIRVSGCSDSGFNGDYALSTYTTDSGGPVYLQTNGDMCLYHLQDYWWLGVSYSAFPGSYYCYDNHDANTPPISTAWYTISEEPVSGMKTELV